MSVATTASSGLSKIFVASGVTSSLFASLLPFIRYSASEVYGVVRAADNIAKVQHRTFLKNEGVRLIDTRPEGLAATVRNFFINRTDISQWRILWFSTHDDAESLRACSIIAPTLAIGSGT